MIAVPDLRPADLVFTRGTGLFARGIRWATREPGEGPTLVNHTAVVVGAGPWREAPIVEALHTVERNRAGRYAGSEVAIYRPYTLEELERRLIVDYLEAQVGNRYGYLKILSHLVFQLTGDERWLELNRLDRYPICSFLASKAFGRVGLDFGVTAGQATPDDQFDFADSHPQFYLPLWPGGYGRDRVARLPT